MDANDEALWRALQPLRSVACWLMTGAHPDDEWSGFLAWLAFGCGVHTVYACATRGEGGQNALGPERGRMLGVLRSREMELAASEIDLTLRWIGAGPAHGEDDPIFDFGFSKSGEDTLRRWGETRLLDRLVQLIRAERPDVLSPTFLDVPGQHGHHRAVTRCTLSVAELAADPGYRVPGSDRPAWRVSKIYLPAFSGAGGSYDDRLPPPPETVRVDLGARCAVLGESWARIGERSRHCHASQGMGRDLPDGPFPLPLHLAFGRPDAGTPMGGIAHGVGELAGKLAEGAAARALHDVGTAIETALAAFPDRARVAAALHDALGSIQGVALPAGADDIARRLAVKRRQLGWAAALALGIGADIAVRPEPLRIGGRCIVSLKVHGPATARLLMPDDWSVLAAAEDRYEVNIPANAKPFGTERDGFDPLCGNDPVGATLRWTHRGSEGETLVDPCGRLGLAPEIEVTVTPSLLVRRTDSATPALLTLTGAAAPPSWPVRGARDGEIDLAVPPGRLTLPPAGARLAWRRIPGTGPIAKVEAATASMLRAPIAIDREARVGVIAGEADETLGWLQQLDIGAEAVDDATLASGDLARFTTLLVGILGFGQRPALRLYRHRLIAWIEAGGSFVTLYHRPGDAWDDGCTPPRQLVISSPSFRWRAADPAAVVTVLRPDHDLLTRPNIIVPSDWDGWVRERGLYFACAWDPAYRALLEVSDPGEPPLRGALLAAPVGKGRHVHVALALHHQFTALVPGAFRLLANLVAGL